MSVKKADLSKKKVCVNLSVYIRYQIKLQLIINRISYDIL